MALIPLAVAVAVVVQAEAPVELLVLQVYQEG